MYKTAELFDLSRSISGSHLEKFEFPWQAVAGIKELITALAHGLDKNEFDEISENVWVHKSVKVAPFSYIGSPCIIGKGTEIRQGAFIRGSAIIGENCVIGNSAELKNCIIFDCVQVPHFNYVGDSILGYKAHLGAGAITSNVKGDRGFICVTSGDKKIKTGLKKLGAMVGDYAEIGCNCVLNPGTVIGRGTCVYPLSSVRGTIRHSCIYKSAEEIIQKE